MIKVLLVDDHKIIRDGIRAILNGNKFIRVVGECEKSKDVYNWMAKHQVDVVLMDISLKESDGIKLTKDIVEKYPSTKIIMLSMHGEESFISKSLKVGAAGYLLKSTNTKEIVDAIKKVHKGEMYLNDEIYDIVMSKLLDKKYIQNNYIIESPDELTSREIQILKLVLAQLTSEEIGKALNISPRTVGSHRRNLMQKIGVKNAAGLARWAVEYDIEF